MAKIFFIQFDYFVSRIIQLSVKLNIQSDNGQYIDVHP